MKTAKVLQKTPDQKLLPCCRSGSVQLKWHEKGSKSHGVHHPDLKSSHMWCYPHYLKQISEASQLISSPMSLAFVAAPQAAPAPAHHVGDAQRGNGHASGLGRPHVAAVAVACCRGSTRRRVARRALSERRMLQDLVSKWRAKDAEAWRSLVSWPRRGFAMPFQWLFNGFESKLRLSPAPCTQPRWLWFTSRARVTSPRTRPPRSSWPSRW